MKYFPAILVSFFLISCSQKNNEKNTRNDFVFPEIADSLQQAHLILSPDEQCQVFCPVLGIGRTGDTLLRFLSDDSIRELLDYDDRFDYREYHERRISVIVDTETSISKNPTDFLPPPPPWRSPEYVLNDLHEGLRGLIIDSMNRANYFARKNDPALFVKAYPVFILNRSDSVIHLGTYDGRLYLFQQALDSLGNWRSIEYYRNGKCGNGFAVVKLNGNEYLCSSVYQYCGNFKTKLRVALKVNSDTIYSDPFAGSINYSQFAIPEIKD